MPGMPARRPAPVVPVPPVPPPPAAPPARPAAPAPPPAVLATATTAAVVTPLTTGSTRRARTRTTTATTPRTHRVATTLLATHHYGLGTWLTAMMIVILLVSVAGLGALLYLVPRMIDSGTTTVSATATSAPVVAPAPALPVHAASPTPQFADVEPAPAGLGREGCKEWYNRQGFSSREFWDEDSQTCK